MERGILVAIEGIDGAGKSTQIAALATLFGEAGLRVFATREPTDGPFGKAIRATATTGRLPVEEELALFQQDRDQHVRELIRPELAAGAMVLIDRYYFSTAAYQGIRGLDPAKIVQDSEARFPRPDLLVVLDLTPDQGLARVDARGAGTDQFERRGDLARCADIFRSFTGPDVVHLDAARAPEAVTRDVVAAILRGPLAARHDRGSVTSMTDLADTVAPTDPSWLGRLRAALSAWDRR